MADCALTRDQTAVLARMQQSNPDRGLLSAYVVDGRRAGWSRPRLEALQRRGLVRRHPTNVERWHITEVGLAVDLKPSEATHG